jgi:hypothetical protein
MIALAFGFIPSLCIGFGLGHALGKHGCRCAGASCANREQEVSPA